MTREQEITLLRDSLRRKQEEIAEYRTALVRVLMEPTSAKMPVYILEAIRHALSTTRQDDRKFEAKKARARL